MIMRIWRRFMHFMAHHGPEIAVVIMILVFIVVYFADDIFYNIPPGSIGVLWQRFGGTVMSYYLGEGLHVIWPWDKIYIYNTRLQQLEQDFDVLSADGLKMTVNIAYRFQAIPQTVPALQEYIGPNYVSILLTTEIGARARDVFSRNTPEEIFSDRRIQIQQEILQEVQQDLRKTYSPMAGHPIDFIKLDDVLIRGITLPPAVEAAINRKEEQKQLNLEYDYVLLREAKEAERKRIEAQGIQEFQDIVSTGITPSYLKWKGIEATEDLARSNNAKIVIIGAGKNGLPIILGNMGESTGGTPSTGKPGASSPSQSGETIPLVPGVGDDGNAPPLPPSATTSGTGGGQSQSPAKPASPSVAPPSAAALTPAPPAALPPAAQPAPTQRTPRAK